MIEKNTLLILGAGASMDYGFPSGKRLIQDIINLLHGNFYHFSTSQKKICVALALQRYYQNKLETANVLGYYFEKVEKFINALLHASPASIDDFIDKNREEGFDIIGKICIVLCISSYEKTGEPFFIQSVETSPGHHYYIDQEKGIHRHWEIKEGWYGHLWEKIYEGNDTSENLNKFTFITFNYDRSLEYFLYTCFINMIGKSPQEAAKLFNENVVIYHVYGQIGYLSWQDQGSVKNDYMRMPIEPVIRKLKDMDIAPGSRCTSPDLTDTPKG